MSRLESRAEALAALESLNRVIGLSVQLLREHGDTLDQFFAEQASMASVGPILDPTLFNSSERRAAEALVAPIYRAARDFVSAYDRQTAAARAALPEMAG